MTAKATRFVAKLIPRGRRRNRRPPKAARLHFETLENKLAMSATAAFLDASAFEGVETAELSSAVFPVESAVASGVRTTLRTDGVLKITCQHAQGAVNVRVAGTPDKLVVRADGRVLYACPLEKVAKITFVGSRYSDTFKNDTAVPAAAWGGAGNDTLIGGSGDDQLHGQNGNNTLRGRRGCDALYGGAHHDRLFGGAHRDTLIGFTGNDRLYGGDGRDRLDGQSGDDRLYGGDGDDVLIDTMGNDRLHGQRGNDKLYVDVVVGRYDLMRGGAGKDKLFIRRMGPWELLAGRDSFG